MVSKKHVFRGVLKPPYQSPWPVVDESMCDGLVTSILSKYYSNFCKRRSFSPTCYDDFLVVGINSVSRAMEKHLLDVCIVAKDVKPITLISHLPSLAFHTTTHLLSAPTVSAKWGAILGIRSVIAIGFLKNHPFTDLSNFYSSQPLVTQPCIAYPDPGPIQPSFPTSLCPQFTLSQLSAVKLTPISQMNTNDVTNDHHWESEVCEPMCGVKRSSRYIGPIIDVMERRGVKKVRH
ncbi:hypothetical protein P9112_003158 [Eukaryota sp. TZLM1-RC]